MGYSLMATKTTGLGEDVVREGSVRLVKRVLVLLAVVALGTTACGAEATDAVDFAGDSIESNIDQDEQDEGSDDELVAEPEDTEDASTDGADDGSDETASEDANDTDDSTDDTSDGLVEPTVSTEVVLVDAGAEPRSELRLQLQDGGGETMVLVMSQEISQTVDGNALPSPAPIETTISQDLTVTTEDDLFRAVSVTTDAVAAGDLEPAVLDQTNATLQAMIGLTTEALIDDQGRLIRSGLEGEEVFGSQLGNIANDASQMSAPLPDEAVGVGAVWEVSTNVPTMGLDLSQTATYELVSIDGTEVTLAVSVEQTVPDGAEIDLGLGVPTEVVGWISTGSGSVTLDLTRIVPLRSEMVSSAVQEFEITQGGQPSVLSQSVDIDVVISPG